MCDDEDEEEIEEFDVDEIAIGIYVDALSGELSPYSQDNVSFKSLARISVRATKAIVNEIKRTRRLRERRKKKVKE